MKHLVLILAFSFSALLASAHKIDTLKNRLTDTTVIDSPQVKAQFPGGVAKLFNKYIVKIMRYPAVAVENHTQGKVILKLLIEKDGSISTITVIQSVSPELDAETIRIMKNVPKFIPASVNGYPVRSYYILPVTYSLAGS